MKGLGTAVAMIAFLLAVTLIMIVKGAGDTEPGRAAIATCGSLAGIGTAVLLLLVKPKGPRR